MKKEKKSDNSLIEGLLELAIVAILFGIGALVFYLFGVRIDSLQVDGDTIILLGIVVLCVLVAIVSAIIHIIKYTTQRKK